MELWKGAKALVEEFIRITTPQGKLVQMDLFYREGQWNVVLLLKEPDGQVLMNVNGKVLCAYQKITPLFQPTVSTRSSVLIDDLLEQASVFRTRATKEQYQNLCRAIKAMGFENSVLAEGYLVEQDGLVGVVDPDGNVIVPVQYASVEPFPFEEELGEAPRSLAGLYQCRKPGHDLNPVDVYDLKGHCILKGISEIRGREYALVAPKDPERPQTKRLKSLWVSHQTVDQPFPEEPGFLITKTETRKYTLSELAKQAEGKPPIGLPKNRPLQNDIEDISASELRELFKPMAEAVSAVIGYDASEILQRLEDYDVFLRERKGSRFILENISAETALDKLGLTVPAYTCLIRSGLRTVGDLLKPHRLRNASKSVQDELDQLMKQLEKVL